MAGLTRTEVMRAAVAVAQFGIGAKSSGAVTNCRTPWLWLSLKRLPAAAHASSEWMFSRAQFGRTDQVT